MWKLSFVQLTKFIFVNRFHALLGSGKDLQAKCQNTLKRLYILLDWEHVLKEIS